MAEESQTFTGAFSPTGAGTKVQLECPFDLETVFTMQYSTEGLKGVLKWIIDNLGDVRSGLSDLDKKVTDRLKQVDL